MSYTWIDDFRKNKEGSVGGIWFAFCIVTFIMTMLSIFVFEDGFQWWMGFPIGILFILAIAFTIMYFTVENIRVCPNCSLNIPNKADFCKFCGVELRKTCPKCGNAVIGSENFCEKCGYNLKTSMSDDSIKIQMEDKLIAKYCGACGYKLSEDSKYCSICGKKI